MGTIQHDAVVAMISDRHIDTVRSWIDALPEDKQTLFFLGPQLTNMYAAAVMTPDGSKEGWEPSNEADELREKFLALMSDVHADWVHASWGDLGDSAHFAGE